MSRLLRDRYLLGDVIGAGGAAKVYRATDTSLDRVVAVKLLDDAVARSADPAGRERFLHEAKTAARFQHPNLVTVYDAGEDDGDLFLVMEFVDGATLADVIAQRAPLDPAEAVAITEQLLAGLSAVHTHGMVHRDVKPANVLVANGGGARLADFGIAKQLDEIDAAVTAAGMLIGTPHYLAPEQATGRPLTPATDVYQVGLVLHEMLTGQRAGGSTPAAAAHAEAADPRATGVEVPAAIADVVTTATQLEPADRFESAHAMAAALAGVAIPSDSRPRTATMPMPAATASPSTGADTVALPGVASRSGAAPATIAATPLAPLLPDGVEAAASERRRKGWLVGGAIGALAVIGGVAIAAGGDGDATLVPGLPTTAVTESTPAASPPLTTAVVAPTTVPVPPPTTAPAVVEADGPGGKPDKPGKGEGEGRGPKDD